MNWIIFIIVAIVLIWLHHLYQNKVDREERRINVSSFSTSSPWVLLRQKFKSYLDFKIIEETPLSLLIMNDKGEEFNFQMIATNSVITYSVNGTTKKEWKFPFWVHEDVMYREIDRYYSGEFQEATPKSDILPNFWKVIEERDFTQEEIDAVSQAVVVASQYGNSVEFTIKSDGKPLYMPLEKDSAIGVGEVVDMTKAKVQTLEKQGESDIVRVKI